MSNKNLVEKLRIKLKEARNQEECIDACVARFFQAVEVSLRDSNLASFWFQDSVYVNADVDSYTIDAMFVEKTGINESELKSTWAEDDRFLILTVEIKG